MIQIRTILCVILLISSGSEALAQEAKSLLKVTISKPDESTNRKSHYLGEEYLNGIIYYLYTDSIGEQHGLIVSKTDTIKKWQTYHRRVFANRTWDGYYNTNLILNSPAKKWIKKLGDEWYLPSLDELSLLWQNRFHVNKALFESGNTLLKDGTYWSSTEKNELQAWTFSIKRGSINNYTVIKLNRYHIRAVRSF